MSDHIYIKKKIKSFNKKISVSSDKSISIRAVLLASQAVGTSELTNLLESEDVMNALKIGVEGYFITFYPEKQFVFSRDDITQMMVKDA